MSGDGSSGKNYYGFGKGKGGRKGDPIIWDGPLESDFFPEPVFEFSPQHKSEFTNETPLRRYDDRREPWPKYRHGEVKRPLISKDLNVLQTSVPGG